MAVHDLGYQRWQGTLEKRWFRWAPMVRYHYKLILKRKLIWLILLASVVPAIVFSGMIYFASDGFVEQTALDGLIEEQQTAVKLIWDNMTRQGDRSLPGPQTMEEYYWAVTSHGLFILLLWPQTFIVMLVASAVGAGLIAQDIRSNALEIYLTKPITPLDYVKGKLFVVSSFIMFTTFVPALLVYIVAAASWQDFFGVTWLILPRLFLACLIGAIANGLVILGLSSLARSGRYATVIWFAMGFITSATSAFLRLFTDQDFWAHISYRDNFLFLIARLMDVQLERFQGTADHSGSFMIATFVIFGFVLLASLIMRKTIRAVEAS